MLNHELPPEPTASGSATTSPPATAAAAAAAGSAATADLIMLDDLAEAMTSAATLNTPAGSMQWGQGQAQGQALDPFAASEAVPLAASFPTTSGPPPAALQPSYGYQLQPSQQPQQQGNPYTAAPGVCMPMPSPYPTPAPAFNPGSPTPASYPAPASTFCSPSLPPPPLDLPAYTQQQAFVGLSSNPFAAPGRGTCRGLGWGAWV